MVVLVAAMGEGREAWLALGEELGRPWTSVAVEFGRAGCREKVASESVWAFVWRGRRAC